ncbi:MAG: T9SS type A sorting domain-containing protein [Bacteroidales bacterium]|nr:T9SS type A sorting domain-containing protein [Bacteroidales bacterium]
MRKFLLLFAFIFSVWTLQAQSTDNKCWAIDYETWNTTGQPSLFIDCGNDEAFNLNEELSLEVWVRAFTFAENRKIMGKIFYQDPINNGYVLGFENLHVYAEFFNPSAQQVPRPGDGPIEPDSSFVHLVTTFSVSSGKIKNYVNGVLSGETSMFPNAPISPNDNPFIIGNAPWDMLSFQFYGDMDEVRVWNKALSATEINAAMHHELSGTEPNLVAYYNFNEASGSTIPDSGPNGFDGTLSNSEHESTGFVTSGAPVGNSIMADMTDIKAAWYRNSENHHRITSDYGITLISNIQEKEFRKYLVVGQNELEGVSTDFAPENPPNGFMRSSKEFYINAAGNVGGSLTIMLEDAVAMDIPAEADINRYALLHRANADDNFTAVMRPTRPLAGVFQWNDITFKDGFYAIGYAEEEFPIQGWIAVQENAFAKLILAPNPVKESLQLKGIPPNTTLSIYALSGARIKTLKLDSFQQNIDLSNLEKGIYIAVFESDKGITTNKIIKQ